MNDEFTIEYFSKRLGQSVQWRKDGEDWVPVGVRNFREPQELSIQTGRESNCQVVFREGADPFLLRRQGYDRSFTRDRYTPDPFEPKQKTWRDDLAEIWDEIKRSR